MLRGTKQDLILKRFMSSDSKIIKYLIYLSIWMNSWQCFFFFSFTFPINVIISRVQVLTHCVTPLAKQQYTWIHWTSCSTIIKLTRERTLEEQIYENPNSLSCIMPRLVKHTVSITVLVLWMLVLFLCLCISDRKK